MSFLYQESAHCCYCCCCCCYGYYFLIQRQSRLDSTRRSFAPFFLLVTLRPISCLMLCGRKTIFALVKSPKWRNYFRWFKREKLNGIKTKQVKIYFYDDATARTITTKDLCIIRCRKKKGEGGRIVWKGSAVQICEEQQCLFRPGPLRCCCQQQTISQRRMKDDDDTSLYSSIKTSHQLVIVPLLWHWWLSFLELKPFAN